MSSKLSPFTTPIPLQSSLLKKISDSIPPTLDLEQLHDELKELKKASLARAKKAGEDLKTIEESMRRMKEKEKGKAKAVEKIKRERDFTPVLDVDEARSATSLGAQVGKPRLAAQPPPSVPPSQRSSLDPRRLTAEELKKKKKKRKRELDESDVESEFQRPVKSTPPIAHPSVSPLPPKPPKPVVPAAATHFKPSTGPDFSVPPSSSLLLPRPPVPPPPIPGPSKPTEVMEDFSKQKIPAQILVTSFYSSIEPWLRNIREEDVGFLEYTGDEVEPYVMPKLGRHYLDMWEDQDSGILPVAAFTDPQEAPPSQFAAPVPRWDPSTLVETDLLTEEKGHGPLTERVISALLSMPDKDKNVWKGVKAAEDAMEGRPGGSGAAAARREKMNVSDLENRIRDTMRLHGLLDGVPDFTEKVDDPIATALRHAQKDLRRVVATNKARKKRLVSIARDRLGYQEYLEVRDSIDKNITTLYSKLQKKDAPKMSKKKKKVTDANGDANGNPVGPQPCPAAVGLNPDEENRLRVNDQLMQLVETRRMWVDKVGSVFEQKQREHPGRIWGFPQESIYQGVDEEVQAILSQHSSDSQRTSKGKERANEDNMDVG